MIHRQGYFPYNLRFSVGDVPGNLVHLYFSNIYDATVSDYGLRPYAFHQHAHVELQYVRQGKGTLITREDRLALGPGDLVMVPPQLGHKLDCEGPSLDRMIITLHLFPPAAGEGNDPVRALYAAICSDRARVVHVTAGTSLHQVLEGLGRCVVSSRPGPMELEGLRALCSLLLLTLYRQLPAGPRGHAVAHGATQQAMFIDDFLLENFAQKNISQLLARELHVSPRHLNRLVRAYSGMNLREKLNAIRLNFAIAQLTNTSTPVAQIAHLMGYSSTTAFGSFIRSQTGMSPSQLRDGGKQ